MQKNNILIKKISISFVIIGSIFSLSSCLKHDDNYNDLYYQGAGVAFINASPDSKDLDLIADNVREKLPGVFGYDSSYGNLTAYPGYRVFGFTKPHSNNLIVSQQFYLHPNVAYSVFIADTLGSAKLFCFTDTLNGGGLRIPDTTANTAYVRFVNMSPDSKALNLISGNDTLFNSIAFGKATAFTAITPNNFNFSLNENGVNTTLSTLNNINFAKGGIYTVWARGFENTSVDSLKVRLQQVQNNESTKQMKWE